MSVDARGLSLWTPAGLLVVACLALLACIFMPWRESRALDMPVDLRPGVTRSQPFTTDYAAPYEVGLVVGKTFGFEETQCRLGNERPSFAPARETCAQPSRVALVWAISENGKVLTRGGSAPGQMAAYSGATITRELGRAPLRPGHRYVLEVRSLSDASDLAAGHPRITVEAPPSVGKDALGRRAVAGLASIVGIFAALGWLMFALVERVLARRRNAAP